MVQDALLNMLCIQQVLFLTTIPCMNRKVLICTRLSLDTCQKNQPESSTVLFSFFRKLFSEILLSCANRFISHKKSIIFYLKSHYSLSLQSGWQAISAHRGAQRAEGDACRLLIFKIKKKHKFIRKQGLCLRRRPSCIQRFQLLRLHD